MISTRYLTSAFINRCTALDLKGAVFNLLKGSNLSLTNIIQMETDGLNVNLKLFT